MKGKTTGQTPNNFTISNRDYNTYRYNLSKEKLHFSFHSLLSFSFCNFSYPLYFSLLFRLPSLKQFFKIATILILTCWDFYFHWGPFRSSLLQPIFTGRMASPFISSSFPSFLPFTLFKSSHNKCKPLTLTLLQPKSLSLALIGRMALLVSFHSSFPSVSQV